MIFVGNINPETQFYCKDVRTSCYFLYNDLCINKIIKGATNSFLFLLSLRLVSSRHSYDYYIVTSVTNVT